MSSKLESSMAGTESDLSERIEALNQQKSIKGSELMFRDLCLKVDKRYILKDVNGLAKPGEFMAIMGPSGAGKTTLLNCLAGRKDVDTGVITMNSRLINKQLRRKISYVLQQDIFLPNLTCWQTIWFTALLRLPGSMPIKEKEKRVYEIIDALDMRKCLHTVIGDVSHRGLSGGERKRTSIACELLTNPSLMLLDEPTSGLDSSTAYSLCSALKSYAKMSGKTVIITIHQPSSQIFNMFDTLLLLCEGQVAFYGDIRHCSEYFSNMDLPCPPNYNLADHILDQVKYSEEVKAMIVQKAVELRDETWYPKQLKDSCTDVALVNEKKRQYSLGYTNVAAEDLVTTGDDIICNNSVAHEDVKDISAVDVTFKADEDKESDAIKYQKEYNSKWPTSFWLQYSVLARRCWLQTSPLVLCKWNFIQWVVTIVLAGMLWFQIKPLEETVRDRLGLVYFVVMELAFTSVLTSTLSLPELRPTLNKERLAGYYRLSAFYLAKVSTDLPLILIVPTFFGGITFWVAGLNHNFWVFLQYQLTIYLLVNVASNLGGLYASLILDMPALMMCSITTTIVVVVSSGFFVGNLPVWAAWLKYGSFLTYGTNALLIIDLSNARIRCSETESLYTACKNITTSVTNNSSPLYIPTEDLLNRETLIGEGFQLWHIYVLLISMSLLFYILTYIAFRFVRKPHLA